MTKPSIDDLFNPLSPLVSESPLQSLDDAHARKQASVKVMYGETFDDQGLPIDALKYYAWLAVAASALAQRVGEVVANVIVADAAVSINKEAEWGAEKIAQLAARQLRTITRFGELCNIGPGPVPILMNQIVVTGPYRDRRATADRLMEMSKEFHESVVGSVRSDHVEEEKESGFRYSLDEVALIAGYDLKVGPPREQFYDRAARILNRSEGRDGPISILLSPTYPLAVSPGEFVKNRELHRYGVTAYKAGSLGFLKNRLVIGRDDSARARDLICNTKLVRRVGAPNAVTELSKVLQLVQWALDGQPPSVWLADEWENHRLDDAALLGEVCDLYTEYIDRIIAPHVVQSV